MTPRQKLSAMVEAFERVMQEATPAA